MQEKKYIITFDLKTPSFNYGGFYSALQNIGPWWHYLQSTWIIKSTLSPQDIYERLAPLMAPGDFILVIEIVPDNKFGWLPKEAWTWLDT